MKTSWRQFVKNGVATPAPAGAAAPAGFQVPPQMPPMNIPPGETVSVPTKFEPFKYISEDGKQWRIPSGKTVGHVAQEWNRAFPHLPKKLRMTTNQLMAGVPGGDPRKVRANTWYPMPYNPYSLGMMRFNEWVLGVYDKLLAEYGTTTMQR